MKVSFVGTGCGDPRLLTLRAAELIAEADAVIFDPEIHPDILGRVREGTPRIPAPPLMPADLLGGMLADEAKTGKNVVRLTFADPLLFGWADAESLAVSRAGVPIEVVPGISAFVAVGAFAGAPLTRSSDVSQSVAVVSVTRGHEALHDWEKLATATDTLAIACDADSMAETARSLVFYGRRDTDRVTIVESVSLPTQRVTESTLGEAPLLPRPRSERVVMLVGENSAPLPHLAWLEKKPLFGRRVLVTRTREQSGGAAALLRERGADPVIMPTIEIHAPSDPIPMIESIENLSRYGWVVFTSANGVERTFAELRRQGRDARAFANAQVAAIGPGTAAALEHLGITADVVAKEHRGEGLAKELLARIDALPAKPRVLVARAEVARDVLPDALRAAGCDVDVVSVYMTRSPPRALLAGLAALLEAGEIDAVTFTSASTVDHLCDALEARAAELLAHTCVASIGPITTEAAQKRGVRVDVTANASTLAGLVSALESHFAK